jgi:hypothetical protein
MIRASLPQEEGFSCGASRRKARSWLPAFAGMTGVMEPAKATVNRISAYQGNGGSGFRLPSFVVSIVFAVAIAFLSGFF